MAAGDSSAKRGEWAMSRISRRSSSLSARARSASPSPRGRQAPLGACAGGTGWPGRPRAPRRPSWRPRLWGAPRRRRSSPPASSCRLRVDPKQSREFFWAEAIIASCWHRGRDASSSRSPGGLLDSALCLRSPAHTIPFGDVTDHDDADPGPCGRAAEASCLGAVGSWSGLLAHELLSEQVPFGWLSGWSGTPSTHCEVPGCSSSPERQNGTEPRGNAHAFAHVLGITRRTGADRTAQDGRRQRGERRAESTFSLLRGTFPREGPSNF